MDATISIIHLRTLAGGMFVTENPPRRNRSAINRTGTNPALLDRCLAAARFENTLHMALAEAELHDSRRRGID